MKKILSSLVFGTLFCSFGVVAETVLSCRVAESIETVVIAISDVGNALIVEGMQDSSVEETIVKMDMTYGTSLVKGYEFPYERAVFQTDKGSSIEIVLINGLGQGTLETSGQPVKPLVQCTQKSFDR